MGIIHVELHVVVANNYGVRKWQHSIFFKAK